MEIASKLWGIARKPGGMAGRRLPSKIRDDRWRYFRNIAAPLPPTSHQNPDSEWKPSPPLFTKSKSQWALTFPTYRTPTGGENQHRMFGTLSSPRRFATVSVICKQVLPKCPPDAQWFCFQRTRVREDGQESQKPRWPNGTIGWPNPPYPPKTILGNRWA